MDILQIIVHIVLIVISVLLIVFVMMQQTKSGGLGSTFGGETQTFTVRGRAASKEAKLQKLTVISACVIGALAIILMIIG